ncbi:MAG: DUF4426 domain-containing protein [Gammaproteobacteria bacterium]|nr:DUF4426 domain-containing protein [Gammaproteobacteria bacterium]NND40412.1 DUF4426 domain-containing protein [Pseudomonadales bacterium]NNM11116.1 DUF4426 domain-containing protein [Pseudomonadales bacterium]RZV60231.1 MAG: DUF4426 domain-containing protein [Pseudomonadales bacterium]
MQIFVSSLFFRLCNAVFALLIPVCVIAQPDVSHRQGDYEVYYSAFNTSFLKADVARAVGVVRAADRGLLNISVLQHSDTGSNNVPARVTGESYDLLHRKTLAFKEIAGPGARYYISPFKISNDNEMIVFDIVVKPENSNKEISFQFKRRLFQNP